MRIAIASAVSAVVLFFFGFLWWGILMPILKPADVITDTALVDQITALPESGVYFHPAYDKPADEGTPMAMVYFKQSLSMGTMMGAGLFHMFLCSALAAAVVTRLDLPEFSSRFGYVFATGVLLAIWADFGNMIWWHHPPVWTLFHFAYDVLSWTLAGLVIAAIARPRPPQA